MGLVSSLVSDWSVLCCRFIVKVPVHRIKKLQGFLVRPNGVEEEGEQEEAYEEQQSLNQWDVGVHLLPMIPTHPPHVVGHNHTAVEHVNHHPLVSFPEESLRTARL